MENETSKFTAEQYYALYLRAFSRLEDISRQAEQAMRELEELQLCMGDPPSKKILKPPSFPFTVRKNYDILFGHNVCVIHCLAAGTWPARVRGGTPARCPAFGQNI